jgi:hypothetical protein
MQLYRFATSGYDSDEEIWLGRDEPIKDFKQAVVDSILKCHEGWSERNLAKVFTIWGSLLPDVCDILCRDYPEYLTLSGEDKLVSIENAATRDSFDKWEKKDKRILESLRGRSPEELSSLLKMSLNPDDWEVDMFEFGCQDDT